jgi:hypothetical protein
MNGGNCKGAGKKRGGKTKKQRLSRVGREREGSSLARGKETQKGGDHIGGEN